MITSVLNKLESLSLSTFELLHIRVGSWPYPQTLHKASSNICKLQRRIFYSIGTWLHLDGVQFLWVMQQGSRPSRMASMRLWSMAIQATNLKNIFFSNFILKIYLKIWLIWKGFITK
jgi:hypothetical protein